MTDTTFGKHPNRAPLVVTIFLIACTSSIVLYSHKAWAIGLSASLLVAVLTLFARFSLSMLRSIRDRRSVGIVLLIAVNVLTMIVLFANLYRWIGLKYPSDFAHESHGFWEPFYFSVVTWTTLGFGDVLPTANSRPVVEVEALAGYVVMALLIGIISAMMQR